MTTKKNTSESIVSPTLCPRRPATATPALIPLNVINLRPGPGGALVPVGENIRREGFGGSRPLLRLREGTHDIVVASSGTDLIYGDLSGGEVESDPDYFGSAPLCAIPTSASAGVVMCADGALNLNLNSDATIGAALLSRSYPAITLIATDANPVSTTVAQRTLSRSYDGSERLSAADTAAVTSDLIDAYRRLASMAGAAGFAIQPAIARYRLIDTAGRCVFTSAPVLLAHSSGSQCASTYGITSPDRRTLDPYTVDAQTWTLEVHLPDADTAAHISRAEIYLSPLFHSYIPGAAPDVTTSRASSASTPFVQAALPGRERSLANTFRGNDRRMISAALARLDTIERLAAVITDPFSGPRRTVKADISFSCDCVAEARALSAALARSVSRADRMHVLFSPPHSFTARCAASDAATIAWANLSARPFPAYPLASLAASFGSAALWHAVTRVKLASGLHTVLSESHISPVPQTLNPLLSYPLPDAVELSISVTSGGITRAATFPLTTDESARCAVYAAGLQPITLPVGSALSTTADNTVENYPDAVAVAPAHSPLDVESLTRLGSGPISTIIARGATDQAWEFGRSRFIAGAHSGIFSVGVAAGRSAISCRHLSSHPVTHTSALCAGDDGEAFALTSVGSEIRPLHISPRGSVTTFAAAGPYIAVAFDSVRAELWLLRADSSADVFCLRHGGDYYRRTGIAASAVHLLAGEPFATSPTSLIALSRERPREMTVGINYSFTPRCLAPLMPLAVEFNAASNTFGGRLSIEAADAGAGGRTYPLTAAKIDGALLSPLTLRTVTRPARRIRIGLEATVSPDFTFSNLKIRYRA